VAAAGCEVANRDTVRRQDGGAEFLALGDSIIRNGKSERASAQCFPEIGTEQLKKVVENGDLDSPDTVVIHIGTNGLRRTICDG
jgi:hypothetical protein